MSYLEELLPEFRKGAKITRKCDKNFYYVLRDGDIYNSRNQKSNFDGFAVVLDDWELYQEPIDWDYIIKNKCLCWFWDGDEGSKDLSFLSEFNKAYPSPFLDNYVTFWKNCRPVRKDEVTFYEDGKDKYSGECNK